MACINRLFLVKGIFFYFNMLYSRLTCIPNTGRSLNSDAAFYENVALVGMKPITDVSVKLFFRFSVNQSNASNTASNTSDFVTVVMSFLESESRSKRECTRVIRGGRLGNKFFRSLTQRLLSNPKFVSVLLADHICEYTAEIEQNIEACQENRVDSSAQQLVRDQLIKMIKCGALVWPEAGVGSPPRHDAINSESSPPPSKRARCSSAVKAVHPTTPVRMESKHQVNRCTPKSTAGRIAPLRVADCVSWSSTFAEAIVSNDVVQNLDEYVGYSQLDTKLCDSAIKRRLKGFFYISLSQSMHKIMP